MTSRRSGSDSSPVILAAVEGGGTSFRVAVAEISSSHPYGSPTILHRTSVDSSHNDPHRTLQECASFLRQHRPSGGYHALGVATFGPAGVNPSNADTYGTILSSSPKQAWRQVDLLTPLVEACSCCNGSLAVRFETDVNAPALAEFEHYNRTHPKAPITSMAYVTVGTGVGVGLVVNGKTVHGSMHPEGGHVAVQPLEGDFFEGYSWGVGRSPYFGKHTVEGIASSVALTERLAKMQGVSSDSLSRNVLSELPDSHPVWDHAANALANLCVTLLLVTSMEQIVLGGGVMKRIGLLERVQRQTIHLVNGYLELPDEDHISSLITSSTWGDDAGLMGAVILAQKAYEEKEQRQVGESSSGTVLKSWNGFLGGALLGIGFGTVAVLAITSLRRR